jgi:hypothetical protein
MEECPTEAAISIIKKHPELQANQVLSEFPTGKMFDAHLHLKRMKQSILNENSYFMGLNLRSRYMLKISLLFTHEDMKAKAR